MDKETSAGSSVPEDGAGRGDAIAFREIAAAICVAGRATTRETIEATYCERFGGYAGETHLDEVKAVEPAAEVRAPSSHSVERGTVPQAMKAVAERSPSPASGSVGTEAARTEVKAAVNFDFDPFADTQFAWNQTAHPKADAELLTSENSGVEGKISEAAAAEEATLGEAEASVAERGPETSTRADVATPREEVRADGETLNSREAGIVSICTPHDGKGVGVARRGSAPVYGGGEPVAAKGPVIATEVAAPQGAVQLPRDGAAEKELDSIERTAMLGREAVAGKEATSVTVGDIALKESVRIGEMSVQASEPEGTSANTSTGNYMVDENSILRQVKDDLAAIVTKEAFVSSEQTAHAAEGTTVLAKSENAAPLPGGAEATPFHVHTGAAGVEAGLEGTSLARRGKGEELKDLTAPATGITRNMTGASLEPDAGTAGAPLSHNTDQVFAVTSGAATPAVIADGADGPLRSTVGSRAGVAVRATTTAPNEDGFARETVLHEGGNPPSVFALQAAAAHSVPLEVGIEVKRDGRLADKWETESTALQSRQEASRKAAPASYETGASEVAAQGTGDNALASFVGVQQPLTDIGSGSYSTTGENISSTCPGDANRKAGSAELIKNSRRREKSNDANINSNYDNTDGDGGTSVNLPDNCVRSGCSSDPEGVPSDAAGQHYCDQADTQLYVSQNFRGSTGVEGGDSNSCSGGLAYDNSSSVDVEGGSVAYNSSSTGMETLMTEEMAAETSFRSSGDIPTADVTDRSTLLYLGTSSSSAGYPGNAIFNDSSAAAAAAEEDATGGTADVCNGVVNATWRLTGEEEEPQADEGELGEERGQDPKEVKPPWRGVLGADDLLTERDSDILQLLAEKEPSIPDEICNYFLHRVGCATTDRTVARLVSVAAQLQLERVMDDAKIFALCTQSNTDLSEIPVQRHLRNDLRETTPDHDEPFLDGRTPDDVQDLDLGSLCAALQKNDDSFSGLSLDCFLDAAPVFLPALPKPSGKTEPGETVAVSTAAFPPTVAELTVEGAETGSSMISGYGTPLKTDGLLPYPPAYQSSLSDMQPASSTIMPVPYDAVSLNTALRMQAWRGGPLYETLLDEYDVQPVASSVNSEAFAPVSSSAIPLHSADATGEMPTVLSASAPFVPSAAPLTHGNTYPPVDAMLENAPAAPSQSGAGNVGYTTNTEAAADLCSCAEAVNTTGVLNAGLAPACISNAVPFAEVSGFANDVIPTPRESATAGMMFEPDLSTLGALRVLPEADSVSPSVMGEVLPVVGGDMQVTDHSSADAGAEVLRAAQVDISVGAVGAPAGDSAVDGFSAADGPDGSIPGAGTPLLTSALSAPSQSPTTVAASVLPAAGGDDVVATHSAAGSELIAYTPPNATISGASVMEIEGVPAGTSLLATTFSSASVDASSSEPSSLRGAAVFSNEVRAVFATDTTARVSAESALPSERLGVLGSSCAESVEASCSTSQHSEPMSQGTAVAAWETAATQRETTVSEQSGAHQSTGNFAATEVLKKP